VRETLSDRLPRGSVVVTREDVAGVDKHNFLQWAKIFVDAVADLTNDDRTVLLIYDGYRSHLGLEVLNTVMNCGVLAYALPAHTAGTTQPLDVGIFSPSRRALNKHIHFLSTTTGYAPFDVFYFAKLMRAAFDDAFMIQNIKSAFRKTGLWPQQRKTAVDPAANRPAK
jgi:hypothetical protein